MVVFINNLYKSIASQIYRYYEKPGLGGGFGSKQVWKRSTLHFPKMKNV